MHPLSRRPALRQPGNMERMEWPLRRRREISIDLYMRNRGPKLPTQMDHPGTANKTKKYRRRHHARRFGVFLKHMWFSASFLPSALFLPCFCLSPAPETEDNTAALSKTPGFPGPPGADSRLFQQKNRMFFKGMHLHAPPQKPGRAEAHARRRATRTWGLSMPNYRD